MAKLDEIKEKMKRYLQEKCNLDVASCYAVSKDLTDDFWDEWRNAEEISQESQEDFSEFDLPPKILHPTLNSDIKSMQDNPQNMDMKHIQSISVT